MNTLNRLKMLALSSGALIASCSGGGGGSPSPSPTGMGADETAWIAFLDEVTSMRLDLVLTKFT